MKYKEVYYDKEKGEWVERIIEEEGNLGFSITANFPIERLKKNKNKEGNKNENETQENKE